MSQTEAKTKQEEIREGIDEKRETILNFIRAWGVIKHPYGSQDAEGCLAMLSDLGVVIKTKCPDCQWSQFGDEIVGMTPCLSCNSTGYIIEPLIKDDNTDKTGN